MSRCRDGGRTARFERHFDDVGLVRDVTLTPGADWRPIDAYLRFNHQGRALGAGGFRFGAGIQVLEGAWPDGGGAVMSA